MFPAMLNKTGRVTVDLFHSSGRDKEGRGKQPAFEQVSHLWSTPRFLFFPLAIGIGVVAVSVAEALLSPLVGESESSRLMDCVGLEVSLANALDTVPSDVERRWEVGGGEDDNEREANDKAAAAVDVGLLAASLASLSLLLVLPVDERRL
jgi:hypothetical protein